VLAGLTLAQIRNLPLEQSKNARKVADLFEVSGEDTENIHFKNSTSQLDYIGYKMTHGTITIEGNAGDFLGANMQNGSIICQGNTGDRAGDLMRRGLILIDGNTGDYCASRMIAGTIGVYGKVGQYVGFAMKRGTVLLNTHPLLHETLQDCGAHTLPFLALLYQSFSSLASKFSTLKTQRVQRFAGDLACSGHGEILVLLK
ncbi:MAG: formylmethanofuran dehydrogenase subunit C, partial [Methylotenera sp.]|nr:formylmethanofuran dehydrogenase subunit C [Methylotenera sp.]